MKVSKLVFNPLQENTYVISDNTGECVVIDPGCQSDREQEAFKKYIESHKLNVVALLNTHGHFDHVFGNRFIVDEYKVESWIHHEELRNLERFESGASLFGMAGSPPHTPHEFLQDGMIFEFGESELKVIHTPGHTQGGVCFYSEKYKFLISGDTLFAGSIGRTDLPGGDYDKIMQSLGELMKLPSVTVVYPGHGPETSIGYELINNPFINGQ